MREDDYECGSEMKISEAGSDSKWPRHKSQIRKFFSSAIAVYIEKWLVLVKTCQDVL